MIVHVDPNPGYVAHVTADAPVRASIGEHIGPMVEPLNVTENGTYTAPSGKAYNPVAVDVGGSGSDLPHYWLGGYEGDGQATATYSHIVQIGGQNGKYLLIAVMTRSDLLNLPDGVELLDKTTYNSGGTQYVYVFKYHITTDDIVSLSFGNNTLDRKAISWWIFDRDFTLTKTLTSEYFQYYTDSYALATTELTFFTFNAFIAQTSDNKAQVFPLSHRNGYTTFNGAWINMPFPLDYQLRFFTGMIQPSDSTIETTIKQIWNHSDPAIYVSASAQVVAYTISAS